jgi:diaminohydroxyphosphoribosylaminopyrimidine deaminase/5-amino-6-(5-phosphoribosylamino)uracil reductase
MNERRAMERALVLARRGLGTTRPNPPVGAVVVRDGRVVGEGFHARAGEDHAEVIALRAAGDAARGADLFVTLEPCNHTGRTGPCTEAILAAGIARVHIAAPDPDRESASGSARLREAGVTVDFGLGARAASHLLAGFASRVERGRPRFTLKMAASLDGRIATAKGESRWISSSASRAWVHRRRREADAILVGSGTVARDNPALTTRAVTGRSPDRFVLDTTLSGRPDARVWTDDGVRRVVLTTEAAPEAARETLRGNGVEVWVLPGDDSGRVSLPAAARRLGEEGYTHVLCEGGGKLAGSLFAEHLVDTAWVFLSRRLLLGGGGAPGWTEGLSVSAVPRAPQISRTDIRPLGDDWLVTLVPEAAQWWDPEILTAPAVRQVAEV